MIDITTIEPISSLEHFPVLSETRNFRRKTPQVMEYKYNSEAINFWGDDSEHKNWEKTHICKSVKTGEECLYGRRCNAAHYRDQLVIKTCNYPDRCNRVKFSKGGKVKNVDPKTVCRFLHTGETENDFFLRLGISEGMMERPVVDPAALHFTKMCNSYFDKTPCEGKEECTYAHSVDQLKVSPCNFKEKCNHVSKMESGEYTIADGTKKICRYLHPEETKENYEKRVLANMKKYIPKADMPRPKLLNAKREPRVKESKEEVILNVPTDMAVEMLSSAISSGQKNIKLSTY